MSDAAIGNAAAGTLIGMLVNSLQGESIGRGAATGALTGLGVGLGGNIGRRFGGEFGGGFGESLDSTIGLSPDVGGVAGMTGGGILGYQLAQRIHEAREKKKKETEKESGLGRTMLGPLLHGAGFGTSLEAARAVRQGKSWEEGLTSALGGAVLGTATGGIYGVVRHQLGLDNNPDELTKQDIISLIEEKLHGYKTK